MDEPKENIIVYFDTIFKDGHKPTPEELDDLVRDVERSDNREIIIENAKPVGYIELWEEEETDDDSDNLVGDDVTL